jgi:tRNA-2-methylthio-N6-dimethylallyladenosine synthase
MRVFIKTYGCQMNERDSEAAAALLASHGYELAAAEDDADIVIVNTCSVRGKAEDKALGKLGLLVRTKRARPERRIGVIGCMVQRLQDRCFRKVPGLDFALGTHALGRLPVVLEAALAGEGPVLDVGDETAGGMDGLVGHLPGGRAAFINILFGCDRRCAYCVVPSVRGHERSRPASEIVDEVKTLSAGGVREVTLLGQSVMSYGRRQDVWPEGVTSQHGYREPLPRLLEAVSACDGIERVRFTSGHPSGCTQELARAMSELPEVCEHLHLPLQSGADRVLESMRRGYTADDYRQAVDRLRSRMPDMGLTTDIIVGFPTETLAEFEETRRFMDEMRFDNAFIFKYSPRPDTPAADWDDDVPEDEKRRRNQVLLEDQDRRGLEINAALVGRELEVQAEGVSLRNPHRWSGRSRTNKIVVFDPTPGLTEGSRVMVRIDRVMAQTVYGSVVTSS